MEEKRYHKHKNKTPFQGTEKGILSINTRGVGYFASSSFEEDIEIRENFLKTALNGDEVEVKILPKMPKARQQGEVVQVLKRAKEKFVGIIKKEKGACFFIPDDRRVYRDFVIEKQDSPNGGVKDGVKVLVKLTHWDNSRENPQAKIIEVLGMPGVHNVEMESIVLDKGFDTSFPREVEKEAERIAREMKTQNEAENTSRKDLRNLTIFTIDPADAKDFDDAVSVRELDGELYEIGVHIADVSHYVVEETALNEEAKNRGLSVYLVDRTIPMLPHILSDDLCSLNPNTDKLAFSVLFTMDKNGIVHSQWFGRTIINSKKRFSYEEAQDVIDNGGKFQHELKILNKISKKLREKRFKVGAIDFETQEVRVEIDNAGHPTKIYVKERLDTHKLIEEFMLLANRAVAEFMFEAQKKQGYKIGSVIYRIHDVPDKDKIKNLAIFVRALGHMLSVKNGKISGQDLNALLQQIDGKAEESLIKTAAVRTMAKAVYSTKNIGHYGLAFQYYTHFTSPIRRYPDLLIHRVLGKYLENKNIPLNEYAKYEKIAAYVSGREKEAADAERESIKYKQVEYMQQHIGKIFKGIISGVSEWGLYISEKDTRAEGMVKVRDMNDDYYELNEKTYSLLGKKTGQKYSLGDEVTFRLTGANLERRTLDYVLV
ncbi:MAG: ribonuclease R [Candidatus Pacebacteria bacterium]|nr:ribonuclease R [Candidatus Paceibacterota bacterium]